MNLRNYHALLLDMDGVLYRVPPTVCLGWRNCLISVPKTAL
jgi:hypothetical protein